MIDSISTNSTGDFRDRLDIPVIWGRGVDGGIYPYYFHLCPVDKLPQLETLFYELANSIASASLHMEFKNAETLYTHDEKIRCLCHEILKLNGINPNRHNVTQITDLCIGAFGSESGDSQKQAILLALNFQSHDSKPVKLSQEQANLTQYIAKLEGDIIASKLLTATETRQLFKEKPLDYVVTMFEEMLKRTSNTPQIDPELDRLTKEITSNPVNSNGKKVNPFQQAISRNLRKSR